MFRLLIGVCLACCFGVCVAFGLIVTFPGCSKMTAGTPKIHKVSVEQFKEIKLQEAEARAMAEATEPPTLTLRPTMPTIRSVTVADTVADALARIGPASIDPLVRMLRQDANPNARANAARALAQMGPQAEPALAALIAALNDPDEKVKQGAARALGQIGPPAADAVPALIRVLEQESLKEPIEPATIP